MANLVITIARQYGSGGKTIGQEIAQELGIPCYNREICRMASDDSGINETLFNEADERLRSGSLFGVSKNIYSGQLIPPSSKNFVSPENLFYYQAKVIKELVEKESCIIIGRCADFVLKDYENVARIFVYASKDFCMEKAAERVAYRGQELEDYIAKKDKYRAAFYHYYTGNLWSDARNYDLCLDSSKLGFEKTKQTIKDYVNIRFNSVK